MGSLCNESFEDFLASLKEAGIAIKNEPELRERLAEARRWRYAFMTLAANGESIGIQFSESETGSDKNFICTMFARYEFPADFEAAFVSKLQARH